MVYLLVHTSTILMTVATFSDVGKLYTPDGPPAGVCVYLHSLTQGPDSPFAEFIIQGLLKLSFQIVTMEFSFLVRGVSPSPSLEQEIKELNHVLRLVEQELHPNKLWLVGKSLGGVIALAQQASANQAVDGISILGLPAALGFPPRLDLLKGGEEESFNEIEEYQDLFRQIKIPVRVIQGTDDDLGPVSTCEKIFDGMDNVALDITQGDHSFQSGQTSYVTEAFTHLANHLHS